VAQNRGDIPTEENRFTLTRRRLLQGAGGLIAASTLPAHGADSAAPATAQAAPAIAPDLTGQLARYMVSARDRNLSPKVLLDAKHRVLDGVGPSFRARVSDPATWLSVSYAGRAGFRRHPFSPPTSRLPPSTLRW